MDTHEAWCGMKMFGHTDAAKRMADTYNLHRMAGGLQVVGKWFAAALADGRTDDVLYDDKLSCVTHQKHNEKYFTFVKICPSGMKVCEAEVMLRTSRQMYEKNLRMADPDHRHGGQDVIRRLTVEDQLAQMNGRNTGLIMPWEAWN